MPFFEEKKNQDHPKKRKLSKYAARVAHSIFLHGYNCQLIKSNPPLLDKASRYNKYQSKKRTTLRKIKKTTLKSTCSIYHYTLSFSNTEILRSTSFPLE